MALRDEQEFFRWRSATKETAAQSRLLAPILFEAFREAVERRFEPDVDVREITRFLLVPRLRVSPDVPFRLLEAEALIRSALGERGLVQGIDGVIVAELRMQLFVHLVEDLQLSETELDELLTTAERYVAEDFA